MNNYKIKKYQSIDFETWNSFVETSINGTFLFNRNFMDYHKDRFQDYSLMIYDDKLLVAILPANKDGETIYSHQGLSYGGVILPQKKTSLNQYVIIVKSILTYLNGKGITNFYLKQVPSIYNFNLSEYNELILFWLKAKLDRCDVYSVLNLNDKTNIPNRNRKRAYNKAQSNGLEIKETDNFDVFWNDILTLNLKKRFNVKPVHTLLEIKKLKKLFPQKIKLHIISNKNEEVYAGALIFVFENIIHFQYSSGNDNRENGALDFLFINIIKKYKDKKYVSFGSSMTDGGINVSKGLLYWKESLGSESIVQKYFKIDTSNYKLLNNRII